MPKPNPIKNWYIYINIPFFSFQYQLSPVRMPFAKICFTVAAKSTIVAPRTVFTQNYPHITMPFIKQIAKFTSRVIKWIAN